ncbi:sialin [Lepeophtheirus salmonis]|uniref:sialin n=1 Tax=Lepeophtheirus salmonis TaxID=72036 RepID=UPI001AE5B7BF|nr:sialin-like [Lepeophtheirus salmonis]XP_040570393.1 sialin-like [Lepeophtheirus salmonis]XP_040570401.1 sialin-like [Lepeophtheirus salmonis]
MPRFVDKIVSGLNFCTTYYKEFEMRRRYVLVLMGFLGFAIVYGMRVNLSVAMIAMVNSTAIRIEDNGTDINNECTSSISPLSNSSSSFLPDGPFDWDEETQGFILSSFFYGYFVTQIPGGRMAEIMGGKLIFGIGVFLTAIFTIITPWVAKLDFYLLIVVRILGGLSEGVTFPAMHAMLSQWAPPLERSRMSAFTYTGAQLGTVISEPLSGFLISELGWEWVFIIFGSLGIFWFIFWLYLIHDSPMSHPKITEDEREYILSEIQGLERVKNPPKSTPWKAIFTSLPFWSLLVVQVANNWSFYTLLTETPLYLNSILHFNIKANAILSGLPYLINVIIAIISSMIADRLISDGHLSTTHVRKLFNSLAFVIPALSLIALGFVGCNAVLAVFFIVITIGVSGCNSSGFKVNHIDIASNYAGTLMGISNSVANITGIIVPSLAGIILNRHNNLEHWRIVFLMASASYLIGNTVFVLFGSGKEQPWNHAQIEDEQYMVDEEKDE